jgi:glycosyltransferase involved in cell wall biosynthesis
MPEIAVLMPVYNASKYIHDAIDSILAQSFRDFSLLIVDDGSTDDTPEIVTRFKDRRIRYIPIPRNEGIVKALNKGIEETDSKYIARMDADDVAMPERLSIQKSILDNDSSIGVVGSALSVIGTEKKVFYPNTDSLIKICMLEENSIAHPSVVYRTELVKKRPYSNEFPYAEDYNLWVELSFITRYRNISQPLVNYRTHSGQVSSFYKLKQSQSREGVKRKYLQMITGVKFNEQYYQIHNGFIAGKINCRKEELLDWVDLLRNMGLERGLWNSIDFERFVEEKYLKLYENSLIRKIKRKFKLYF